MKFKEGLGYTSENGKQSCKSIKTLTKNTDRSGKKTIGLIKAKRCMVTQNEPHRFNAQVAEYVGKTSIHFPTMLTVMEECQRTNLQESQ